MRKMPQKLEGEIQIKFCQVTLTFYLDFQKIGSANPENQKIYFFGLSILCFLPFHGYFAHLETFIFFNYHLVLLFVSLYVSL